MRLGTRIKTLERRLAARPVRSCPACGGDRTGDVRITFDDGQDLGPETCPRCGRRLVVRIEFDRRG